MRNNKKKLLKYTTAMLLSALVLLSLFSLSVTLLDDPLSQTLRSATERHLNQYIEALSEKSSQGTLCTLDKALLHTSVLAGITLSRLPYPEASALLYHYVYADGSDLELPSSYFEQSAYLQTIISRLGEGQHGPIALKQDDDWRLSLALNPYYLTVTPESVRLYHPNITFASVQDSDKVMTVVPIGKLKLNVYDRLISALNPKPFYVYSEWPNKWGQVE